jgi:hypothetical protein
MAARSTRGSPRLIFEHGDEKSKRTRTLLPRFGDLEEGGEGGEIDGVVDGEVGDGPDYVSSLCRPTMNDDAAGQANALDDLGVIERRRGFWASVGCGRDDAPFALA